MLHGCVVLSAKHLKARDEFKGTPFPISHEIPCSTAKLFVIVVARTPLRGNTGGCVFRLALSTPHHGSFAVRVDLNHIAGLYGFTEPVTAVPDGSANYPATHTAKLTALTGFDTGSGLARLVHQNGPYLGTGVKVSTGVAPLLCWNDMSIHIAGQFHYVSTPDRRPFSFASSFPSELPAPPLPSEGERQSPESESRKIASSDSPWCTSPSSFATRSSSG